MIIIKIWLKPIRNNIYFSLQLKQEAIENSFFFWRQLKIDTFSLQLKQEAIKNWRAD